MRMQIIAQGLATAFGATGAETTARLGENALAMRRLRSFLGADFKPQLTAFASPPDEGDTIARINRIADAALVDLAAQLVLSDHLTGLDKINVAVCLPIADGVDGLSPQALQTCAERLGTSAAKMAERPIGNLSFHFQQGSGFAEAIVHQIGGMVKGEALIVICADSYACRARMSALNDQGLLFSNVTPYGLTPGEGASAILLRAGEQDGTVGTLQAAVATDAVGEADTGDSDYAAMAKVCHDVSTPQMQIRLWVSDWNNSRYRAAEFSYAQLRMTQRLHKPLKVIHSALLFGDTGAAGPAISLALALAETPDMALITTSGGLGCRTKGALHVTTKAAFKHPTRH